MFPCAQVILPVGVSEAELGGVLAGSKVCLLDGAGCIEGWAILNAVGVSIYPSLVQDDQRLSIRMPLDSKTIYGKLIYTVIHVLVHTVEHVNNVKHDHVDTVKHANTVRHVNIVKHVNTVNHVHVNTVEHVSVVKLS